MSKVMATTTSNNPTTTTDRVISNIPTKVHRDLSIGEQYFILEGIRDNCRTDGRSRTALRPFELLTCSPIVMSHGSSRHVAADRTEILCSVKAELVRPSMDAPDHGVVEIHVDFGSDIDGDYRKRRHAEQELQASLHFLLERHLIPLESLCVVSGHYVWRLGCDLLILQHNNYGGGSIVDAASRALRGALLSTKLPHMIPLATKGKATVDLSVDGDYQKAAVIVTPNDDLACPIVVSVSICKCPPKSTPVLILDATKEEELCSSCTIRLAITKSGIVLALQTLNGSLPVGVMELVQSTAIESAKQVYEAIEASTIETPSDHMLQPQFNFRM